MRCRILPHRVADGPTQMGLDTALLESVDERPDAAVLRTYEWSAPTLSLGYFQEIATAESDPRWRGVPVVRRPSGGGAIWHHHELTYALIVPRRHPPASRAAALYRAVHAAIATLLAEAGAPVRRRGGDPEAVFSGRPFLCFTDRDREDIVLDGWKVVGSAQRRRPNAVLQHGSILLNASEWTPELPGLGDVADLDLTARAWAEQLNHRLPGSLGLTTHEEDLTPSEAARAAELARCVYSEGDWTRRR
jgi:lipoate-protein ligase A